MKTSTTLLLIAGAAAAGGVGWWFYKNKYLAVLKQRDDHTVRDMLLAAGGCLPGEVGNGMPGRSFQCIRNTPRQCQPGYVSNPPYFDCVPITNRLG